MLKIYSIPVSLYCAKLRIVLRHKQMQWQEVPPPGGYGSDEYKLLVPSGNLPALEDGDLLISDSEAIAEYLNEQHPDPPMLPVDKRERAKVRELSRFHDTRLEPELRRIFAHIELSKRNVETVTIQTKAIATRMTQLARILGDGPSKSNGMLTLGDCGYPVTFTWIELLDPILGLRINWSDNVNAYLRRITEHRAVREELASYRPKLASWLGEQTAA